MMHEMFVFTLRHVTLCDVYAGHVSAVSEAGVQFIRSWSTEVRCQLGGEMTEESYITRVSLCVCVRVCFSCFSSTVSLQSSSSVSSAALASIVVVLSRNLCFLAVFLRWQHKHRLHLHQAAPLLARASERRVDGLPTRIAVAAFDTADR